MSPVENTNPKTQYKMKAQSVILYASLKQLTPQHQFVATNQGNVIFIRAVEFEGNFDDALDAAKPLEGESVLNSVPFSVK